VRYLDALCTKAYELDREDLGTLDPNELKKVKGMWEWFQAAAHAEELVATMVVAELTET
jgi:hypothetical protein